MGDIIVVGLLQNVFHVMWFMNQGIFNVYGMMALSPLSWTVTVMIFLYFLPSQRGFLYPYITTWASCSIAYGLIVRNAGLYNFVPWLYPIPIFFVFFGWWSLGAWLFLKTSSLADSHIRFFPQPARKLAQRKK